LNRLSGKIALVTGATQGMGRAVADLFHAEGATVVATDVSPPAAADQPVYGIERLDVASEGDWQAVIRDLESERGRLDVLVNNAGIMADEDLENESLESWERVVAVNQTGLWLGMRETAGLMRRSGGGSIVNFSSIWGCVGVAKAASYHASKGAVRTLSKHGAVLLAKDRIRVNSVHPGFIDTPLTRAQDPAVNAAVVGATPLGRAGTPLEVAQGVLFLASDESSFVTGSELVIDGGYLAQ
jgi:NAD(P)-dependent dehydrogenase (short-subunit alcohol dehydrogenase family)